MNKQERTAALKALAKRHPHISPPGFTWKNPLNLNSKGIRWTRQDLVMFQQFQQQQK